MRKRVIQIPVDAELLSALDGASKKERQARSELIRRACQHYLGHLKMAELDGRYQAGYERTPEDAEVGQIQMALTSEVLPAESW